MSSILKKTTLLLCFALLGVCNSVSAQMIIGQDTLYGNEWINYSQKYYKISSTAQGMVRITYSELVAALGNNDVQGRNGSDFRMFYMGKEIPIYVSTGAGAINSNTFIEYYTRPNPVHIDQFLVSDTAKYWFSPNSSFAGTMSPYFLTWSTAAVGVPKRYATIDNGMSGTLPAKENYYMAEGGSKSYPTTNIFNWAEGIEQSSGKAQLGGYEARGFASNAQKSNIATDVLKTTFVYRGADAPQASVTARLRLYEVYTHKLYLYFNNTQVFQENSIDYSLKNYSFNLPVSSLATTGSNDFKAEGKNITYPGGTPVYNDYLAMSSVVLRYPREFNFENKTTYEFEVAASTTPRYIEIANFNVGTATATVPILYDHTNGLRIETVVAGGVVKFVLPPSATKRFLTLRSSTGFVTATTNGTPGNKTLYPISFIDYSKVANQGDYIIIANKKLYTSSATGNWVKEYAAYRSQTGYDTLTIEMDQLYNQFAYGVATHPLSIRNFAWFSKTSPKKFAVAPKYIFLIGKGYWASAALSDVAFTPLVPGFGKPASDNLMMASHKTNVPIIPFGRLSAVTGDQIKDYLTKVKEFEAAQAAPNSEANKAWMKKVLHLIGAEDDQAIPVYMNGMKNTIEAPMYGGKVFTFIKTNSNPAPQPIVSAYLDSLIQTGCSIINMFGHAYADGTDYNLDPAAMNNKGKYPLVLSLGCYSGDMFSPYTLLSERFVLQKDKAAIGFLASVHLNVSNDLNRYGSKFYKHIATDMYGKGIGDIIQQTIRDEDMGNKIINQNLLFHGDPALRLNPFPAPDYIVQDNSVRITPATLSTVLDSFRVDFTGMNIGKAINDTLDIKITREYPNAAPTVSTMRVKAPVFDKDYFFSLPVGNDNVYGSNSVTICMDATNEISELPTPLAESNNCKRFDFQIYSNLVLPVYPSVFGIHNTNTVKLKAAATNPLGKPTSYTMEIDTTETFNSPLRRRTVIPNFSGGLLEWDTKTTAQPTQMVLRDSTVYYWRVKVTTDTLWQDASFVYLNGEYEGWNQSHFYQYNKDAFLTLLLPNGSRKFQFLTNPVEFRVTSAIANNPYDSRVFMNGTSIGTTRCSNGEDNGVAIHVIDPITGIPWQNRLTSPGRGQYGTTICSDKAQYVYNFTTDNQAGRDSVKRFLTQVVPTGHYVFIWSRLDMKAKEWRNDPTNLANVIRQQSGSTLLAQAEDPTRAASIWGLLYRKNTASFPIQEILKNGPSDPMLNQQFLVPGQRDRGAVNSTTIGPATEWGSFHWRTDRTEPTDDSSVDIYGIKNDNSEVLLMPKLRSNAANSSGNHSLSGATGINATTYPRIRLVWNVKDTISRTAPNLKYWRVLYKQIPEAVLRPEVFYAFERDTIVERGETVRMKINVENITNTDMDSLRVKYTVELPDGSRDTKYAKFGKLLANTSLVTDFSYNTRNMNQKGLNKLHIDINPQDAQEQREQYHFNNTGVVPFQVLQDIKNPLLDVTFDGIHILEDDVVSSKPNILITLKDENKYLTLNDTSRFRLFLERGDSTTRQQLYFNNNPEIMFFPANANSTSNNKARVEYKPLLNKDGKYTLYVQATDVAGNESGNQDYKVSFRIINKTAITQILNYPNPFTSRTQFVFTLTGSEVPEDMTIQIFTVTGVLVRTITKAELGNIHVGLNKTDFAWDGTDEHGDRMANGVYLYRVITKRSNGEAFDILNDTENGGKNIEQYFQNGFGKMYMMR
jgi:Peptidase family C25